MLKVKNELFRNNTPTNYLRAEFSTNSKAGKIRGKDDFGTDYVNTVEFMENSKERKVYVDISLIRMFADSKLKSDARKVLAYILTHIRHGYNYIELIGTDIMKEEHLSHSDVSRGITELKNKNIIVRAKDLDMYKDDKNIGKKLYILNHNYAIKGSFNKLKKEVGEV